jgi:glycosyltransferase involved in cell wall biosynthesis
MDKYAASHLAREKAKGASAVYSYEDGALYTFQRAKEMKLQCMYDLPIGYWRSMHNLLSVEKELNPEWTTTLGGLRDSLEKLNRKDQELSLADKIFVASSFTKKTLSCYPKKLSEVHVVPYGFPPATPRFYSSFKTHQKIKLLFVGGLSQRKGLSYLFKAVNELKEHISLTVLGQTASYDCEALRENLDKHTWIKTLGHSKVLELMQKHDVLIFPSLFEGFGLVITEAMAQGTPVITTERTAGPDIIKHGENGWLISAGSAEAIKNVLEQILLRPQLIADVGVEALRTAEKRPWNVYGKELAEAVIQ